MAKKETDSYEDDVLREFNESQKGIDPNVTKSTDLGRVNLHDGLDINDDPNIKRINDS